MNRKSFYHLKEGGRKKPKWKKEWKTHRLLFSVLHCKSVGLGGLNIVCARKRKAWMTGSFYSSVFYSRHWLDEICQSNVSCKPWKPLLSWYALNVSYCSLFTSMWNSVAIEEVVFVPLTNNIRLVFSFEENITGYNEYEGCTLKFRANLYCD